MVGTVSDSMLRRGALYLSNSQQFDQALFGDKRENFARCHATATAAHQKYVEASTKLKAAKKRAEQADAKQDHLVEALSVALIADGQPRAKPFAAVTTLSPDSVKRLAPLDEAKELHRIVAVIKTTSAIVVSDRTRKLLDEIDAAATAVERAQKPLADLEKAATHLKDLRDATAHPYAEALKVFQRKVRSAADDGPRELYAAIFGATASKKKVAKAMPGSTNAETAPTAAPTASEATGEAAKAS